MLHTLSASALLLNAFALVAGFGFGGAFTVIQVWVAGIYGGKRYGSVLGVVTMIDELAGSAGALALGTLRKASGNFKSGLDLMLILCAVAVVSALLVRRGRAVST